MIWFILILVCLLVFVFFISYAFYLAHKSDTEKQIQINEKRTYKRLSEKLIKENNKLRNENKEMRKQGRKLRYKK